MRRAVSYLIRHSPWSFVASVSVGGGNYALILILAQFYTAQDIGQFRLIMSIVGMLGVFSLVESGKILLRAVVNDNAALVRPIFFERLRWAAFGTLLAASYCIWSINQGDTVAVPLFFAVVAAPLYFAADLYDQMNQARREFKRTAIYNTSKMVLVCGIFAIGGLSGWPPTILFGSYFAVLGLCHCFFLWLEVRNESGEPRDTVEAIRQGRRLSYSTVTLIALEHADKLLIGSLFGLVTLGYYTVAVSTGRLILFGIRPILTTLNPLLVNHRLPLQALIAAFALFTVLGLLGAWVMHPLFIRVYPVEYHQYYALTQIVIWGVGLYSVSTMLYSSTIYFKDAQLAIPMISNWITPTIVLIYLIVVTHFGGSDALLLCALSYPLRHFLTIISIVVIGTVVNARSSGCHKAQP